MSYNGKLPTTKLGPLCRKIGSGATPRGGKDVYLASGPFSLIRSQNVHNNRFADEGLAFISKEQADDLSNVEVSAGDVLLNITGDSVARCCQAPRHVLPARVNQHVAIIRPDADNLDPTFLRYFLVSPQMQEQMLTLAGAGATRSALTKGMIENFDVPKPDITEQRAVAAVLKTLDDKIELNRHINTTLEALAQGLFKHWFEDATVDGLPQGWRESRLGDLADVTWGDTNTTKASYSIQGFPAYSAAGCDGFLPHHDFDRIGVVVSAIGANAGVTWLALGKWSCIKNTIRFWATEEEISTEYLFYATHGKEKWPLRGSAQPFIAQGDARAMKIIVPSNKLGKRFGEVVGPLHLKISANNEESRTLAELRDALLPKLLSGEIAVNPNILL